MASTLPTTQVEARLFPAGLSVRQWHEFDAAGFDPRVWGMLYDNNLPPSCGMPLGGIDTGGVDLEADGTLGFCTIFNSHVPRRGPLNLPFLGLFVDGRTWVLTTHRFKGVERLTTWDLNPPGDLNIADRIEYWGHYPVADLEYVTSAPVGVGLRAWSPFIPGDLADSAIPAAVFEVHLRNPGGEAQKGRILLSVPGPTEYEAGGYPMRRNLVPESTGMVGVEVAGERAGYVLAAIGEAEVSTGGALGADSGAWQRAGKGLPTALTEPGASLSVDFALGPGESRIVRLLLAWHSPMWYAGGTPDPFSRFALRWYEHESQQGNVRDGRGSAYTHGYARRFGSATEVAQLVASQHAALLSRILAWQSVVYAEEKLPGWLRDSLVNILHLINETGFWAMAKPPIGDWCRPEDGLWGMNEDPRHCPQIECLPCSYYGNYPVVYLFPQLALSTLRGYKAYQYENGEVAWVFGGMTARPVSPPCEMATPNRGYQIVLNGPCVVDMVYRYWLRTRDDEAVRELYDMVKRSTVFTMNLRPEDGADGIISFPTGNGELEWFEACTWAGMAAHAGGLHLANLRQAATLAEHFGDRQFAEQCRQWLAMGSSSMENKMWTGSYYLNYYEPTTGERSDLVMANQLDGEWQMRLAGLPGVFLPDRVKVTLDTVKRTCVPPTPYGAVNFSTPEGCPATSGEGRPGWDYDPYAFFPPEVVMLGELYMYEGEVEFGLQLCHRCWQNIAQNGLTWDQPNIIRGDTGDRVYGGDYYQNMLLWTLPAAIEGTDLSGPCRPGGLVDRVIQAGTSNG